MSLEEYLRELDRVTDKAESLEQQAPEIPDDPSVEEWKEAIDLLYDHYAEANEQLRDDLNALDPPAQVEEEHRAFINAFEQFQQEVQREFEQMRESIQSARTRDELAGVLLSSGENETRRHAGDRLEATCDALQRLADENNVDVDLECEEDVD